MKITDEMLGECGWRVGTTINTPAEYRRIGLASLEFWAPILLAEPTNSETEDIVRVKLGFGPTGKVNPDFIYGAKLVVANRLRSVLAKPDPAIEAVNRLYSKDCTGAIGIFRSAEEIVAEVDAARAGQKEGE